VARARFLRNASGSLLQTLPDLSQVLTGSRHRQLTFVHGRQWQDSCGVHHARRQVGLNQSPEHRGRPRVSLAAPIAYSSTTRTIAVVSRNTSLVVSQGARLEMPSARTN
jgi:hypothetical protein